MAAIRSLRLPDSALRASPLRQTLGITNIDSTTKKRIERFNQGCCPIHGQFMSQIDRWYGDEKGKEYTVVGCSRNACLINARAYSFDGPWRLPDEFSGLLKCDEPDPVYLDPDAQPDKRKKSLKRFRENVWDKTNGYCYYCGTEVTKESMTIDHLVPESNEGNTEIENLFPSCKSCNSSKGAKDIEAFRFSLQMRFFREANGVFFSREQISFLQNKGHNIEVPDFIFWFERQNA